MSSTLEKLFQTILSRKGADAGSSYTASLFAKGREKIAQKLAEEASETVIEAVKGDAEKLKQESADLLYHLCVVWADAGIAPADVFAVLESRMGASGIDEKNSRQK